MRILRSHKNPVQSRLLIEKLNKYGLAFFFCISLFGQLSAELFQVNHQRFVNAEGKTIVCDATVHLAGTPLEFPFGIEPDDYEISADESGADQDQDYCPDNFMPGSDFRFTLEKIASSSFNSAIENRPPVSLVILHHSWKSFLS